MGIIGVGSRYSVFRCRLEFLAPRSASFRVCLERGGNRCDPRSPVVFHLEKFPTSRIFRNLLAYVATKIHLSFENPRIQSFATIVSKAAARWSKISLGQILVRFVRRQWSLDICGKQDFTYFSKYFKYQIHTRINLLE